MTAPGGGDDAHSTDETLPLESGPDPVLSARADVDDPDGEDGAHPTPEDLDALDTLVGQVLSGRYKVLDRLGSGGMSIVYRARHQMLKQLVAVKVLKRRLAADRVSLTRFHREAMAAASIGSPHIVHIIDYGFTKDGDAFIVMEYLEGMSLRQMVRAEGPMKIGRAVSITRQILRGLVAAHEQGIVHRDLKGDNVFLTCQGGRDFVKLLDFGISKVTRPLGGGSENPGLTSTGVVMGTPQYIAPEQASGLDEVDHRADIYALGVILYEMLTGVLPFDGRTPLEILMKHVQEKPRPPRQRRPELAIPPALDAVVLKALSKEPADRYSTAEEMKAALPEGTELPGGFASGPLTPAPGSLRHSPYGVALAVGLGSLVLVGAISLLLNSRSTPEPDPVPDPVPPSAIATAPDLHGGVRAATPDAGAAPKAAQEVADYVVLEIITRPPKARVLRDGVDLGAGTVKLRVKRGEEKIKLEARAPGYQRKEVEVTPDQEQRVGISLDRVPSKPRNGTKGKGPKDVKDNPYKK